MALPAIYAYGPWKEGGAGITAKILGEKHPIRMFSSWISDMGNAQNTCKLIRLATELLRAVPYVQKFEGCVQSLEIAGKTFEQLRDLPALAYFVDRLSHILQPDPADKPASKNGLDLTKDWLGRVKDWSDCAAMGILVTNLFKPIFNSSENKLMKHLDLISLVGDTAELGRHTIELQKRNNEGKPMDLIFSLRMVGSFLSTASATAKQANVIFKRELAPEWALKGLSFVGTGMKMYASYSEYTRDPKTKVE